MNERSAEPPSGGDDARLRELAERLLDLRLRADPEEERPKLFVGRPPEGLSGEIPVPEGLTVVGGVVRYRAGREMVVVLLASEMDPERVREVYRALMRSAGWFEPNRSRWFGGFLYHAPSGVSAVFCRSRRGPALTVHAYANPDGRPGERTEVRLMLETDARQAPCTPRHFLRGRPGFPRPMLPALRAPRGSPQSPNGMLSAGGGPDKEHSGVILETDLDPGDLEAHYGAQFERAGWRRSGGEASGSQAWSGWTLTDKYGRPWVGTLSVVRLPGASGHYYHVQGLVVVSPDASEPPEGTQRPWWRRVFGG